MLSNLLFEPAVPFWAIPPAVLATVLVAAATAYRSEIRLWWDR